MNKSAAAASAHVLGEADLGTLDLSLVSIAAKLFDDLYDLGHTGRTDGMVCMDLDGNVKWKTEKSPLFDKGGFLLADGLMFSVDGKEGILYLIEPNPEAFKPLANAKLLETRNCWAPPALSDGMLLIRDQKQMRCVVVR